MKGHTVSRTALLAMDLQAGTLSRVPADFRTAVGRTLETARAAGVPVIHVALQLRPGHVDVHPRNKVFGSLPGDTYTAADPSAAIDPDLGPRGDEIVVYKNRVSAFAGNNLQQILAAQDIGHLVLTGIATGGIVLSTALQAADLDYHVTTLSDACADPNPDLHEMLLSTVLARRGDVATTDAWAAALP
jgi:nicotinamidase-related amidase